MSIGGWALRVYSLSLLPVYSLCIVFKGEDVICFLLHPPVAMPPPTVMDSLSGFLSQNELFFGFVITATGKQLMQL